MNLNAIFEKYLNIPLEITFQELISLLGITEEDIFEDKKCKIKILRYEYVQFSFQNDVLNRISFKLYYLDTIYDLSFETIKKIMFESQDYLRKEISSTQYDILVSNNYNYTYSFDSITNILLELNVTSEWS